MKKERVLTFGYAVEMTDIVDAVEKALKDNDIEYILYRSSGYYKHEFVVRRSGKKWDDIMGIINNVKAVKYTYKSTYFDYRGGVLKEVVYCTI